MDAKVLISIVLFTMTLGCDRDEEFPVGYVQWVENPAHGLKISKQWKGLNMQAQYKPLEYIVAMEEKKASLNTRVVETRKLELGDGLDYFNFSISPTVQGKDVWGAVSNEDNSKSKNDLTYYLSYEMGKDFFLLAGQDTLRSKLFQFVNTSGISPSLDFVMAFEKKSGKDRLLVYDDKIFGSGPIQFLIKNESINHTPTLKTQ